MMNEQDSAHIRDVLISIAGSIDRQMDGVIERIGSFAVAYRLVPFRDGNQWCVLLGDNIQEGIAGFGDSPALAIQDFDRAMYAGATNVQQASRQPGDGKGGAA